MFDFDSAEEADAFVRELLQKNRRYIEENKRYRKALKEIANGHLYEKVSEEVAKDALKEEK